MPRLDPFHRLRTSFGGYSASQTWADFLLWERLLNAHPDARAIAEIGTLKGGFSRYLNAQAQVRGMDFETFDINEAPPGTPGFTRCDVFDESEFGGLREVAAFIDGYPKMILLCDGGDKPREVRTFAPFLDAGSLVVVHDWLVEIGPDDVPACLIEAHVDLCDELGSMSRVFAHVGES